jgi:NAD(P)-dependent dehydrogenase (short-subunit alcohol dehydrogenase family)
VPNRLAGKRALVTAAGQGMGRAAVLAFVREGAKVIDFRPPNAVYGSGRTGRGGMAPVTLSSFDVAEEAS